MVFINRMRALVRDDSGQDLLEYALLTNAGTEVNRIFTSIAASLASVS